MDAEIVSVPACPARHPARVGAALLDRAGRERPLTARWDRPRAATRPPCDLRRRARRLTLAHARQARCGDSGGWSASPIPRLAHPLLWGKVL